MKTIAGWVAAGVLVIALGVGFVAYTQLESDMVELEQQFEDSAFRWGEEKSSLEVVIATAQTDQLLAEQAQATAQADQLLAEAKQNAAESLVSGLEGEIASLSASLQESRDLVALVQEELSSTQETLEATEAQKKKLESAERSLQQDKRRLQSAIAELEELQDGLEAQLQQSKDSVASLEQQIAAARQENRTTSIELNELKRTLQEEREQINTLESTLSRVRAQVKSLQEMQRKLETELGELRTLRDYLSVSIPSCTGSMRPAITCQDGMVETTQWEASDLQVGDIIVYEAGGLGCNFLLSIGGNLIVHRIVEIRYVDHEGVRIPEFLPKGDNNWTHDGCWVPPSSIEFVVLKVLKDLPSGPASDAYEKYVSADARMREICSSILGFCWLSQAEAREFDRLEAIVEVAEMDMLMAYAQQWARGR